MTLPPPESRMRYRSMHSKAVDCLLREIPQAQRALKERDSVFNMHKPENRSCETNVVEKNDAR